MTDDEPTAPTKTFFSYSWSSPTHESWVRELATRLRQDGVDVILDKWDLKPGHDAYKFMEQMVTDATVTRVVMICDKAYTEKANSRVGGVGTEGQIISPELYGKGQQDKFAAVITELDDTGKACLPVFYKGRIYFDFSADDGYEQKYDELLRWIVGRPGIVKPAIGNIPRHISESDYQGPATNSQFRRADDAIQNGKPSAPGLIRDFADTLSSEFERLRPEKRPDTNFDEIIIECVARGRPYVDQFLKLVMTIARHTSDSRAFEEILRALERIAQYMFVPERVMNFSTWDFDAFKYLCQELFLCSFAILLKEERFDLAEVMVTRPYLVSDRRESSAPGVPTTKTYNLFSVHIESLESRSQRMNPRRLSIQADMLSAEYESGHIVQFSDLMQADYVLYLRSKVLEGKSPANFLWYPETLVYAANRGRPFDIFARSESKSFFRKIRSLILAENVEEFRTWVRALAAQDRLSSGMRRIPIGRLANVDNLGMID